MDIEFFQSSDEVVDVAPAEMAGYVQILNVSGSIIPVVEGWYLRTHKYAFVHPDNPKVQKLLHLRRIKLVPFKLDKKKKKKQEKIIEVPTESVKKINELETLEKMFVNQLIIQTGEQTFAK